jgi:hypothetical protein
MKNSGLMPKEPKMRYLNLFDEIASIGEKFLKSSDRGHKVLSDYTFQLASICQLIKHTHSIVINKLEEIEKAKNPTDAESIGRQLEGGSLSAIFRAGGLCDIFVAYGNSLRRIIEEHQQSTEIASAPPITKNEQVEWINFCDILENRELQVAYLYAEQIKGLNELIFGPTGQDLKKIKEYAREAKAILTNQVAEFGLLAKRFSKR